MILKSDHLVEPPINSRCHQCSAEEQAKTFKPAGHKKWEEWRMYGSSCLSKQDLEVKYQPEQEQEQPPGELQAKQSEEEGNEEVETKAAIHITVL